MPAALKNVCVVGAPGNIGLPIAHALLASGLFNVAALTRPSSTPSPDLPGSVELLRAEYKTKMPS